MRAQVSANITELEAYMDGYVQSTIFGILHVCKKGNLQRAKSKYAVSCSQQGSSVKELRDMFLWYILNLIKSDLPCLRIAGGYDISVEYKIHVHEIKTKSFYCKRFTVWSRPSPG